MRFNVWPNYGQTLCFFSIPLVFKWYKIGLVREQVTDTVWTTFPKKFREEQYSDFKSRTTNFNCCRWSSKHRYSDKSRPICMQMPLSKYSSSSKILAELEMSIFMWACQKKGFVLKKQIFNSFKIVIKEVKTIIENQAHFIGWHRQTWDQFREDYFKF